MITRKIAKALPATTQIVKLSENEYSLITSVPFKTQQQKFVPGQAIMQTTIDGRKINTIFTIEDNKLIERQIEPNQEVTIIRKFFDTEMLGKICFGNVTNRQWSNLVD